MNILIFKELINRAGGKNPKFFVKLQWIFGILGCLSFATSYTLGYLEIETKLIGLLNQVTTFSVAILMTSQLPKQDKNETPDTDNK